MSEIRRPGPPDRPLIPPVEPVLPGNSNKKFTEGEPHPQPEKIKRREGERKQIWVPVAGGTYNKGGQMEGSWKSLTQEEAEELGLKWED